MYGVLGEDQSDTETLKVIIRRLARSESIPIKTRGYSGCGEMLRKGANQLRLFADLGCRRFIVCYDADGPDPSERYAEVSTRVVKPSGIGPCCIVIPVQELEAWILADIGAVSNIIHRWIPDPIANPEGVPEPKEYIERLSRGSNRKPRYSHAVHNERVARYLNLDKVRQKCPSFRPLADFVER